MRELIFIILSLISVGTVFAVEKPKTLVVRYPPAASEVDTRADYDRAVIDLMLQKTVKEFGPYQLIPSPHMSQSRALENLKDGVLVDVVATTSNREREANFLPIRHCIHQELMGVKIFLIRKGTEHLFANVRSLSDISSLVGGQGHDWPDVEIFRKNGLTITTGSNYEGLFKMLEKKRFDFFPRSLPEVFDEQKTHADKGLLVEPKLALVYNMPAYMFVNKNNTALARRLERGFQLAKTDGSFKRLFLSKHAENIKRADLKNRRIIPLTNPLNNNPNKTVSLLFENQ